MTDQDKPKYATGGPINPGTTYCIGEEGPEPLVIPGRIDVIDWSKVKLTVNIARYWHPTPVEYIEDFAPEFAAQFAEHRGPEHHFALLHSGVIADAIKWHCATCGTGGDLAP